MFGTNNLKSSLNTKLLQEMFGKNNLKSYLKHYDVTKNVWNE